MRTQRPVRRVWLAAGLAVTLTGAGALAGVAALTEVGVRADGPAGPMERFARLSAEGQPEQGANAMEVIGPIAERLRALTAAAVEKRFAGEDPLLVQFMALWEPKATPREREIARGVIEELERSELPGRLAVLAAAPRVVIEGDRDLLMRTLLPQLGQARQITRYQAARIKLMQEAGDWAGVQRSLRELMSLSEQTGRLPMMLGPLVSIAMEALTLDVVQDLVQSRKLGEADLASLATMLEGLPELSYQRALAGERLMSLDAVDFVYWTGPQGMMELQGAMQNHKEGERVKRGAKPVIPDGQPLGPGMPAREEHAKLVEAYFDRLDEYAGLSFPARSRADALRASMDELVKQSLVLGMTTPGLEGAALRSSTQVATQRLGTRVLIAIERYRLANGRLPERLGELVPAFMAAAPVDPFSDGPLGYRPPSAGPFGPGGDGRPGREFMIYSAGPDMQDNGGNVDFADRMAPMAHDNGKLKNPGLDWLLNDVPFGR
jgi:hypothetical protein